MSSFLGDCDFLAAISGGKTTLQLLVDSEIPNDAVYVNAKAVSTPNP